MTDKIKVLWRIKGWGKPIKMTLNVFKNLRQIKALRATPYCGQTKLSINTNTVGLKSGVKTQDCHIKAISSSHFLNSNPSFPGWDGIPWSINSVTCFSVLQISFLCLICQILRKNINSHVNLILHGCTYPSSCIVEKVISQRNGLHFTMASKGTSAPSGKPLCCLRRMQYQPHAFQNF